MGLAKKALLLKSIGEKISDGYNRVTKIRNQVTAVQDAGETTTASVAQLETDLAHRRVVLDALATELDLDADTIAQTASVTDRPDMTDSQPQSKPTHDPQTESEGKGKTDGETEGGSEGGGEGRGEGRGESQEE